MDTDGRSVNFVRGKGGPRYDFDRGAGMKNK